MTSYARPLVIRCPKCRSHLHRRRLQSFNDFGAMGWSDGYTSIWGLNSVSDLGRCPHCKKIFWIDDAEAMGVLPKEPDRIGWVARIYYWIMRDSGRDLERERNWNSTPWEWKNAKPVDLPDFVDMKIALKDAEHLTLAREALLRRAIWREGNDHLRINRDGKPLREKPRLMDADAQENLLKLLSLIDAGVDAFATERGEILRQLGRFDDAIEALLVVGENHQEQADMIIEFARKGDSKVRELWRSQYDF